MKIANQEVGDGGDPVAFGVGGGSGSPSKDTAGSGMVGGGATLQGRGIV